MNQTVCLRTPSRKFVLTLLVGGLVVALALISHPIAVTNQILAAARMDQTAGAGR